jgi:hypothetical protein
VHVVIPKVSSSDLSLWAVPSLPSGGYDTVTKLSSVTIKEGSTANLAWETAGVDAGSCRGTASGNSSAVIDSNWKVAQDDNRSSDTPLSLTGLTKGQYSLGLLCTINSSPLNTNTITVKVIKSTETPF